MDFARSRILIAVVGVVLCSAVAEASCDKIQHSWPKSQIVLVECPSISQMDSREILGEIRAVYDETEAEVDIFIFFVTTATVFGQVDIESQDVPEISAILDAALVGTVYTHNDYMTIWPNNAVKRRKINLGTE